MLTLRLRIIPGDLLSVKMLAWQNQHRRMFLSRVWAAVTPERLLTAKTDEERLSKQTATLISANSGRKSYKWFASFLTDASLMCSSVLVQHLQHFHLSNRLPLTSRFNRNSSLLYLIRLKSDLHKLNMWSLRSKVFCCLLMFKDNFAQVNKVDGSCWYFLQRGCS